MTGSFKWPVYTDDEINAVASVLKEGNVNYLFGKYGKEFEKEFSNYHELKYGSCVSNGTVALEILLKSLNINAGDEVVVPAAGFISTAAAVISAGARPVFADVSLETQNICHKSVQMCLSSKTRAVICVHLSGIPCEIELLKKVISDKNIYLIEDCSQAHGALYKKQKIGSFGHAATWSFCTDKIITTGGEGGMICTNDNFLYRKVSKMRNHGRKKCTTHPKNKNKNFKWLVDSFGTNARMTEMQSTIGLIQLRNLDKMITKRAANSKKILDTASQFSIFRIPYIPSYISSSWYRCKFYLNSKINSKLSRDKIVEKFWSKGIPCFSGACPEIYRERAFKEYNFNKKNRLPNAKILGETSLNFLVHPTLSRDDLDKTCLAIESIGEYLST